MTRRVVICALPCLIAIVGAVDGRLAAPTRMEEAAAARAVLPLTIAPYDSGGIYDVGRVFGWTIRAVPGVPKAAGGYRYTIRQNGRVVIKSGTFDLARGVASIEASVTEPSMVTAEITTSDSSATFGDASTGGPGRMVVGAAIAPTRIAPSTARPADFDAFWDTKLSLLARVPMNATLTPGESGLADIDYATLRMDNVNGARVYGQLAKPHRAGKFPALLILQWASPPYPLPKQWVTDRAAEGWLTLNIEPHDVPSDMPQAFYDALPAIIKQYNNIGTGSRDESYFLSMYLGDYRAVDYLAARDDWDGKTLVVMGTSMGGQQSLSVAGLHSKVTTVIVNEPAGADASGPLFNRASGYPGWDVSKPQVAATAPYFDTVNFASRIRATCLIAMGFIDDVAPPVGIWSAFNQIPGAKEAVPMVFSHHNHKATAEQQLPYTTRSTAWLNALVKGDAVPLRRP